MKLSILFMVLFAAIAGAQSPPRGSRIDTPLEAALAKEDWAAVAKINAAAAVPDPIVAKFINAHAALALNKGDDALCAFAALDGKADVQRWTAWARQFVANHPTKAVGYYFLGDALEREGDSKGAVTAFQNA